MDLRSNHKLPLGFCLGFRELQSLQLLGHCGWNRIAKAIPAGPKHCCSYIFQILATHRYGHLSPRDKIPFGFQLGWRGQDSLELQAHCGWKMPAKSIMAGPQYFCHNSFHIRAMHRDGHLSCSAKLVQSLVRKTWKLENPKYSKMKWNQWNDSAQFDALPFLPIHFIGFTPFQNFFGFSNFF